MIRIISFFGALALAMVSAAAFAQDKPEASNMRLVGYNDLQGRSAYQPWIHHQGDRWIAYIGHHGGVPAAEKPVNPLTGQPEFNGTSITDVTDPAHPKYLAHIPGEQGNYEAGGAQMVRVGRRYRPAANAFIAGPSPRTATSMSSRWTLPRAPASTISET